MDSEETHNSPSFAQRVVRLEKRNRLLLQLNVLLVLVISLMVPVVWKFYREAMSGGVESHSLAIKDNDGKIRARLSVKDHESVLQFYDSGGRVVASDLPQEPSIPSQLPPHPARPMSSPALNPTTQTSTGYAPALTPQAMGEVAIRGKITLGNFFLKSGQYDDAIAKYEEGLALDPSNTELHNKLAETIKACKIEKATVGNDFNCWALNPVGMSSPAPADLARIEKDTFQQAMFTLQRRQYSQAQGLFQQIIALRVPDSTLALQAQEELAKIEHVFSNKAEFDAAVGAENRGDLPGALAQFSAIAGKPGQFQSEAQKHVHQITDLINLTQEQQQFNAADHAQRSGDLMGALTQFKVIASNPGPYQAAAQARADQIAQTIAENHNPVSPLSGTAELNILTKPPGAKVMIDGVSYGLSPVHASLAPGDHTYTVKLPGLDPYGDAVKLMSGNVLTKTVNFGPQKTLGIVQVRTIPPGATVLADGSPVGGLTPTDFRLPVGAHTLVVALGRFQPVQRQITVSDNEATVVNENMTTGAGEVPTVPSNPVVTLIPSGDFLPWNGPVAKGQMLPDTAIQGGLIPVGELTVPPVVGAPPGAFVVFVINIDPDGDVTNVRTTSDDNGLSPQVRPAVRGWKFNPPTVKGKPVSTTIQVKVAF